MPVLAAGDPACGRLVTVFKPNHIEAAAMCKSLQAVPAAVAIRAAATNWATFAQGGGAPLIQAALGASAAAKAAQRLTTAMIDAITLAPHLRQVRSMLLTCGSAGTVAVAWTAADVNPFARGAQAATLPGASAWVHVASLRVDGSVGVSDGSQEEPAAANVTEHLWIRVFAPARPRRVARVTGAGDAFLGAALSSLLRDAQAAGKVAASVLDIHSLARAVAFGTTAAAVVLETEDAAQVRSGLMRLCGVGSVLAKL
jgi:sugar/nucleoside kinase (ribokinase family)